MMNIIIPITAVVARGEGTCEGGDRPDPPIDAYPLLAWAGGEVRTEDGAARVADVAAMLAEESDLYRLAARFGTTPDHAAQAVAYAADVSRRHRQAKGG